MWTEINVQCAQTCADVRAVHDEFCMTFVKYDRERCFYKAKIVFAIENFNRTTFIFDSSVRMKILRVGMPYEKMAREIRLLLKSHSPVRYCASVRNQQCGKHWNGRFRKPVGYRATYPRWGFWSDTGVVEKPTVDEILLTLKGTGVIPLHWNISSPTRIRTTFATTSRLGAKAKRIVTVVNQSTAKSDRWSCTTVTFSRLTSSRKPFQAPSGLRERFRVRICCAVQYSTIQKSLTFTDN